MTDFESQKMGDLDYEQALLLHQICEEVGVHRGESLCTYESYIVPYPVVHNNVPSPSFVFRFTGDSLILVAKNIGHREESTGVVERDADLRPYHMQKPFTFLLADPEFFTKVHAHVYKEWKHGS